MTVHNGPPAGAVQPLPGAGLGLVGLRERVESLCGELAAAPCPEGGFTVRATIPLEVP